MTFQATIFILSLFYLTFVVCTVYTTAREPEDSAKSVVRGSLKRGGKLLGLLVGLGIVTQILSML